MVKRGVRVLVEVWVRGEVLAIGQDAYAVLQGGLQDVVAKVRCGVDVGRRQGGGGEGIVGGGVGSF